MMDRIPIILIKHHMKGGGIMMMRILVGETKITAMRKERAYDANPFAT